MKTFFALALAGIASALELEDAYLYAEVDQSVVNGVTHPADSPLDIPSSTKTQGKVGYQVFFDKIVEGTVKTTDDAVSCGSNFDSDIHMCCFRFDISQPFASTTTT